MPLRIKLSVLLAGLPTLGGCAVGVPLAIIGGNQLVGNQLTARHSSHPLDAVVIPEPQPGLAKPALFLVVERERWDDADKPRGPETVPEYDDRLVDLTRRLFVEQANQHRLFSSLSSDPFDAPKSDYTVLIHVRNRNDGPSFGKALLTVSSGFLITTTDSDDYALRMELRDRQNRLIQTVTAENTKLTSIGIGALGIVEPKPATPPKSVEEQLVMKALRAVAMSGIYARPAPRTLAATAPMAAVRPEPVGTALAGRP